MLALEIIGGIVLGVIALYIIAFLFGIAVVAFIKSLF